MDTAIKSEEEKKELFDSDQILDEKISQLKDLILKAEHFIIFTGAGISTSSGVPDFRSGVNTVLPTGPGCWEKQAQNVKNDKKQYIQVSTLKAIPSKTHMAIVQLERYGLCKYLISQNVDGLHRRSGFPPELLAELHGNTNLEYCQKCGKKYLRDFHVSRHGNDVHNHQTGRQCDDPNCLGDLYDSIINFKENLPPKELDNGFLNSQISDLCLVLGSSLRVNPAAQMPAIVAEQGQNLVIVNLQPTPLDKYATIRINGMCDKVMELLMKKLDIEIPEFILQRRFSVKREKDKLLLKGVDVDGCPFQLFKKIDIEYLNNNKISLNKEPYLIPLRKNQQNNFEDLTIDFTFYGHYQEKNIKVVINVQQLTEGKDSQYLLEYNPFLQKWINQCLEKQQKK